MKIYKTGVAILLVGTFFSCSDILQVEDISNHKMEVLAPKEGAIVPNNTTSFNWDALADATGYHIQVATPTFASANQIVLDSMLVKDTLGYLATQLKKTLLNNEYQWRIKGFNSGYETIFTVNSFRINGDENLDIVPPKTPSLSAPTNKSSQSGTTINFKWTRENVPGTTEKDSIYIYTDEVLQTLEAKSIGANKEFTTTLTAKTYYWNVRAFDEAGNKSGTSNTFSFTIN